MFGCDANPIEEEKEMCMPAGRSVQSLLLAKALSEFCIFRALTALCLLWNHNVLEVHFNSWCSCLSLPRLKLQ